MISNPYLLEPTAASAWAEGFVKGFTGPQFSAEPPPNISVDDVTAYVEGVAVGEQGANDGLVFSNPCISALEPHSPLADPIHAISGAEILHGIWELRHLATLAAGLTSLAVTFIELACTLPVHTLPPEQVLPDLGQPIIDTLAAYGIGSLELFCSAGLDATSENCEILLSPMYKSLQEASQAAEAMGRPEWLVVSWRTDASGSFRVVGIE
jgi:hypothetical protein